MILTRTQWLAFVCFIKNIIFVSLYFNTSLRNGLLCRVLYALIN